VKRNEERERRQGKEDGDRGGADGGGHVALDNETARTPQQKYSIECILFTGERRWPMVAVQSREDEIKRTPLPTPY